MTFPKVKIAKPQFWAVHDAIRQSLQAYKRDDIRLENQTRAEWENALADYLQDNGHHGINAILTELRRQARKDRKASK